MVRTINRDCPFEPETNDPTGVVRAMPPTPPPAPRAPSRVRERETDIDISLSKNKTEVDIQRTTRTRSKSCERRSHYHDDDLVIRRDTERLTLDDQPTRRRAHSVAPIPTPNAANIPHDDPISATAAGIKTIKLCLELVHRVSTAIDLQMTGNSKLETICDDLNSVRDVVKLVDAQEQLKTKGVLKAATNILKITINVDKHVERVRGKSTAGSKGRQITHQFMKGPGEWEILRVMMINLTAAKATLILHIQLAHVGLMVAQGHGNGNVVNINVLRDTNQNVEKFLGKGKGLIIAEVFKDKQPDGTNEKFHMVHIND